MKSHTRLKKVKKATGSVVRRKVKVTGSVVRRVKSQTKMKTSKVKKATGSRRMVKSQTRTKTPQVKKGKVTVSVARRMEKVKAYPENTYRSHHVCRYQHTIPPSTTRSTHPLAQTLLE